MDDDNCEITREKTRATIAERKHVERIRSASMFIAHTEEDNFGEESEERQRSMTDPINRHSLSLPVTVHRVSSHSNHDHSHSIPVSSTVQHVPNETETVTETENEIETEIKTESNTEIKTEIGTKITTETETKIETEIDYEMLNRDLVQQEEMIVQNEIVHDDKAVNFVKAEKFYYETVLIDRRENRQPDVDAEDVLTNDVKDANLVHAEQYDQLARLCLDETQPELALEYAGKAAQLRQASLGDDHPSTKDSLNFFATIYAEVGRRKYTESIEELAVPTTSTMTVESSTTPSENGHAPEALSEITDDVADTPTDAVTDGSLDTSHSPTSILRNRHSSHGSDEKKRNSQHVHFDEAQLSRKEREERLSRLLLWAALALSILLFLISLTLLWCHTHTCPSIYRHAHSLHIHALYYYDRYFGSSSADDMSSMPSLPS